MGDSPEAIAYEEALRSITEQQATLDSYRTRAGTLFSAAAVSTSFLIGLALKEHALNVGSWVAIGCFIGIGVLTVVLLLPGGGWRFSFAGDLLVEYFVDGPQRVSADEMRRDLALRLAENHDWNQPKVYLRGLLLNTIGLLLIVEIVILILVIAI